MRKIKKTGAEIVILENNHNQVLEMSISMKFDAECNETTPGISFLQFHEIMRCSQKRRQKSALDGP